MGRFFYRFLGFLSAVRREWTAFVTGSFMIGLLWAYEHLGRRSVPGTVYWIVAVLALFIAFFKAWEKERIKDEAFSTIKPIYVTRRKLLALQGEASRIRDSISDPVPKKTLPRRQKKVARLWRRFDDAVESSLSPKKRFATLAPHEGNPELRMNQRMRGFSEEQINLYSALEELIALIDRVQFKIDDIDDA